METTNFYEKLKTQFTTFKSSLRLDERQQESLKSLLAYTDGALNTYRNEIAQANKNYSMYNREIRDKKRTEALSAAKEKLQKTLDNVFKPFEHRVTAAEQALYKVTHEEPPKDAAKELLQFMQRKEIRDHLQTMPLAKRTELLLNSTQELDPTILRAVESQPKTSDLVPENVLQRANSIYAEKGAPSMVEKLESAKKDLDGAELIRNLTQVAIGHIEQGLA